MKSTQKNIQAVTALLDLKEDPAGSKFASDGIIQMIMDTHKQMTVENHKG